MVCNLLPPPEAVVSLKLSGTLGKASNSFTTLRALDDWDLFATVDRLIFFQINSFLSNAVCNKSHAKL